MAEVTHKLMLSVLEQNYDAGNFKIRQNDENTQVLDVQITENGLKKIFEGLTPFFCVFPNGLTGNGASEDKVTDFDAKKGTLKHVMGVNSLAYTGRVEAYFSFRTKNEDGSWSEQFSTRSFFYIVEKSIYKVQIKDSNYFWTFEELYKKMNNWWTSVRTVVNSIKDGVIGDVADAHTDNDGIFYDSLSDRLAGQIGKNSDFRKWDKSVIEKMANEFSERGVNVKWFGTVGDGITDDTQAIQEAIDFCVEHILDTSVNNVVLIPNGNYKISKTIVLPPYVKLKSIGNVYLNASSTFKLNTPVIWVKWLNDGRDPSEFKGFEYNQYRIQQFMHDSIIDGTEGNIAITGANLHMKALDNQNDNPDGLWIGNIELLGSQEVVARTFFRGLMLSNLNRAVAIAKHDTFILTFEKVHIERAYICFDDHIADETSRNNGENQVLKNCILSNSHIVFNKDFFSSSYGCSFDFNVCIYYSENGFTGVSQNIFGGHIEGSGSISKTNSNGYNINIFGTRIYMKNRDTYEKLFFGKANVALNDIYWSGNITNDIFPILKNEYFVSDSGVKLKINGSFYSNSIVALRPIFHKNVNLLPHTEAAVLDVTFDSRTSITSSKITTGTTLFRGLNLNQTILIKTNTKNDATTGWFTITLPEYKLKGERQIFLDGLARLKVPNGATLFHNYTYRFKDLKGDKVEVKKFGMNYKLTQTEAIIRYDSAVCDVPQNADTVVVEIGFPFEVANQLNFEYELAALFLNSERF